MLVVCYLTDIICGIHEKIILITKKTYFIVSVVVEIEASGVTRNLKSYEYVKTAY